MENEKLQYKTLQYWIEDGIIVGAYSDRTLLDLELAKKGVEMRRALSREMAMPLLMDIRNLSGATAEARKYLASTESLTEITAGVLLVKSTFTEALGNFFFKISKPTIPKKMFNDRDKAKKWLLQFPAR